MKKSKLHKIAPRLSEISRDSAFKIPEQYFEQLEDTLLFELRSKKFNANNHGFRAPEGYFDEVEDIVITKLKAAALQNNEASSELADGYFEHLEDAVIDQLKSKPKVINLRNRVWKLIVPVAIAASLLLLVVLNTRNNDTEVTFDSLTTAEIESLIDEGMIEIDAESLAMVFEGVEFDNNIFDTSLSNDEVLDYLNDTDLEILTFDN